MEVEKKIVSGSAFILTSRIVNGVSLVIFSITMAWFLGKDTYGLISIAVGFIGIFAILGDLGLNIAGVRFISMYFVGKKYEDIRTIINTSFIIKLILGSILALISYIGSDAIADFFQKDVAPLFKIVALIVVCNLLSSVFQSVMKGLQRMDLFAMSNIFRDISWIVISIGLVHPNIYGWGVVGALWGYLISALLWLCLCAGIFFIPLRRNILYTQKKKKQLTKSISNKLLVFGMPILIMDITILLYNWIDTFVLAYFRPTAEVSYYNIAFGLVNFVMIIIASVSTTLFPVFSGEHALKKEKSQKRIYEKVVKFIIIIIYPFLTFLIFLAPYIVLIYGSQYLPALTPLYILVLWGFFRPVGNIGSGLLTAKGRQKLVMKITVSTAVLNFCLNILLIPRYHMLGAALATTTAFIFGSLAVYIILNKDYDIILKAKDITKALLAAFVSSAVGLGVYLLIDKIPITTTNLIDLLFLILKLLISFLIASIVYLVLLKLIKIFSREELGLLEKLTKEYRIIRPIYNLIK